MDRHTRYPAEVKERAVRMVFEHQDEYAAQWRAISSIATKLGTTHFKGKVSKKLATGPLPSLEV